MNLKLTDIIYFVLKFEISSTRFQTQACRDDEMIRLFWFIYIQIQNFKNPLNNICLAAFQFRPLVFRKQFYIWTVNNKD